MRLSREGLEKADVLPTPEALAAIDEADDDFTDEAQNHTPEQKAKLDAYFAKLQEINPDDVQKRIDAILGGPPPPPPGASVAEIARMNQERRAKGLPPIKPKSGSKP
jgi:hypothetical protein